MPRLVNFVRQVTHDVRNGLNAIDLQSAFIAEIAGEGEVAEEMGKLRRMVSHVTRDMQELSCRFGELRPVMMDYPVQEFLQGLKEAVEEEFETQAKRIVWEVKVGDEEMEMDYTLLMNVLMELTRNAIFFREGDQAIHFTAWNEKGKVDVRGPPVALPACIDAGSMGPRAARFQPARGVRSRIILRPPNSGYTWRRAGTRLRCEVRRIKSPADPARETAGPARLE